MHRRFGARSAPYGLTISLSRIAHLRGFTLVELLTALAVAALLVTGLVGAIATTLETQEHSRGRNELTRNARFAMDRMVRAVSNTPRLLLPLSDKPFSNWPEHIRKETVPPSPPVGSSIKATAVLVVTQDAQVDLDGNGIPDADNDGDGRIDEDPPDDMSNDFAAGIYLIDDDGDGFVDESTWGDDDEGPFEQDEDPINGLDDDNDNNIDEDASADVNGDGEPGIAGVDDDGDGSIDEGDTDDSDEDGNLNEDWLDPVVFYLDNGALMERTPVPWDENASGSTTGRDFIASAIAENVTLLRIERVPPAAGQALLVDLTLELTNPASGELVSLHTRVRVGGAL